MNSSSSHKSNNKRSKQTKGNNGDLNDLPDLSSSVTPIGYEEDNWKKAQKDAVLKDLQNLEREISFDSSSSKKPRSSNNNNNRPSSKNQRGSNRSANAQSSGIDLSEISPNGEDKKNWNNKKGDVIRNTNDKKKEGLLKSGSDSSSFSSSNDLKKSKRSSSSHKIPQESEENLSEVMPRGETQEGWKSKKSDAIASKSIKNNNKSNRSSAKPESQSEKSDVLARNESASESWRKKESKEIEDLDKSNVLSSCKSEQTKSDRSSSKKKVGQSKGKKLRNPDSSSSSSASLQMLSSSDSGGQNLSQVQKKTWQPKNVGAINKKAKKGSKVQHKDVKLDDFHSSTASSAAANDEDLSQVQQKNWYSKDINAINDVHHISASSHSDASASDNIGSSDLSQVQMRKWRPKNIEAINNDQRILNSGSASEGSTDLSQVQQQSWHPKDIEAIKEVASSSDMQSYGSSDLSQVKQRSWHPKDIKAIQIDNPSNSSQLTSNPANSSDLSQVVPKSVPKPKWKETVEEKLDHADEKPPPKQIEVEEEVPQQQILSIDNNEIVEEEEEIIEEIEEEEEEEEEEVQESTKELSEGINVTSSYYSQYSLSESSENPAIEKVKKEIDTVYSLNPPESPLKRQGFRVRAVELDEVDPEFGRLALPSSGGELQLDSEISDIGVEFDTFKPKFVKSPVPCRNSPRNGAQFKATPRSISIVDDSSESSLSLAEMTTRSVVNPSDLVPMDFDDGDENNDENDDEFFNVEEGNSDDQGDIFLQFKKNARLLSSSEDDSDEEHPDRVENKNGIQLYMLSSSEDENNDSPHNHEVIDRNILLESAENNNCDYEGEVSISLTLIQARDLPALDIVRHDPFVILNVKGTRRDVKTSKTVRNSTSPIWDQQFRMNLEDKKVALEFHVGYEDKFGGNIDVSTAEFSLKDCKVNQFIDRWIPLRSLNNGYQGGDLHITLLIEPKVTDVLVSPRFQQQQQQQLQEEDGSEFLSADENVKTRDVKLSRRYYSSSFSSTTTSAAPIEQPNENSENTQYSSSEALESAKSGKSKKSTSSRNGAGSNHNSGRSKPSDRSDASDASASSKRSQNSKKSQKSASSKHSQKSASSKHSQKSASSKHSQKSNSGIVINILDDNSDVNNKDINFDSNGQKCQLLSDSSDADKRSRSSSQRNSQKNSKPSPEAKLDSSSHKSVHSHKSSSSKKSHSSQKQLNNTNNPNKVDKINNNARQTAAVEEEKFSELEEGAEMARLQPPSSGRYRGDEEEEGFSRNYSSYMNEEEELAGYVDEEEELLDFNSDRSSSASSVFLEDKSQHKISSPPAQDD